MQVAAQHSYTARIEEVNRELAQAFKQLKRRKKLQPKDIHRLQKRIKKLVETLTDLKYRASY